MSKLEKAGYRRYWEMSEFLGRTRKADGTRVNHTQEVYRDMVSGEVYAPLSKDGELLGWNGNPPDDPTGSKAKEGTERRSRDAYRENYAKINWSH